MYLQCDNNTSFDEFNILTHGNKKYLLGIKGLLIKRNQPVLNKNISFTTLGYVTFIRHGLMSLVSFYCNNCNLYNFITVLTLSKSLVHCKFYHFKSP